MAYDAQDSVTNAGSGRSKLPARLRAANFAETAKDAVFPSMTTAARTALTLDADDEPTFVYDSDLNKVVLWNGTAWRNVDGTALA